MVASGEKGRSNCFMAINYPLADLQDRARRNPFGPARALLSRGRIEGGVVIVEEAVHEQVSREFPRSKNIRFPLAGLQARAHLYPAGYVDFLLARGKVENGIVVLDAAHYHEFRQKFPPELKPPLPPTPTLSELAANFTGAIAGWAQAGFKVVERGEFERRHAVCLACEFWQPDALLGTGKCRKCGCSKVKLWLATSRCPDRPPRW